MTTDKKNGRPTDYNPAFCERAIAILNCAGKGREHVAADLNVTTQTLRNWRKKYPEFNRAMQIGLNKSKAELLTSALSHMVSSKDAVYNTPLFNRILQTVFRDDESAAVEIEGWADAETADQKSQLVIKALGNGDITPEQADRFLSVLSKHSQLVDVAAIKSRLDALEIIK